MITLVLIITVLAFMVGVLWLGLRGFIFRVDACGLSTRLKPVNIDAVKNLLDPEQDRYLSSRLSASQMRDIRRRRTIVLLEYVWRIAQNAALVLQVSESLRRSESPEMSEKSAQISNMALRIRLMALSSIWFLALSMIWPGTPLSTSVAEGYSVLRFDISYLTIKKPTTSRP